MVVVVVVLVVMVVLILVCCYEYFPVSLWCLLKVVAYCIEHVSLHRGVAGHPLKHSCIGETL